MNSPMSINRYLTRLSLAACTLVATSQAWSESHIDYAKVTHVSPIYETISIREPHRECHLEERIVHRKNHQSATPKIIGALIGGAIGNELGHNKSNKRVGAVAGAILGGSIANDLSHKKHSGSYTKTEKVCHVSHTVRHKKEVTGYDVSYKYRGRDYSTVMDTHPGERIRVAVDVSPVDY